LKVTNAWTGVNAHGVEEFYYRDIVNYSKARGIFKGL
jgi:hypothetical protein